MQAEGKVSRLQARCRQGVAEDGRDRLKLGGAGRDGEGLGGVGRARRDGAGQGEAGWGWAG